VPRSARRFQSLGTAAEDRRGPRGEGACGGVFGVRWPARRGELPPQAAGVEVGDDYGPRELLLRGGRLSSTMHAAVGALPRTRGVPRSGRRTGVRARAWPVEVAEAHRRLLAPQRKSLKAMRPVERPRSRQVPAAVRASSQVDQAQSASRSVTLGPMSKRNVAASKDPTPEQKLLMKLRKQAAARLLKRRRAKSGQ
jgi:hypothetical protein